MKQKNDYFNQALSDFVHENASGAAIRHLADLGYTVKEIGERLDFPTPEKRIGETVWKHYLKTGKVSLSMPSGEAEVRVSYVKEFDEYGKASFRRVEEKTEPVDREYLACNFGKELYRNRERFLEKLAALDEGDRDYVLGLPWPLMTCYHATDERFMRIMRLLEKTT